MKTKLLRGRAQFHFLANQDAIIAISMVIFKYMQEHAPHVLVLFMSRKINGIHIGLGIRTYYLLAQFSCMPVTLCTRTYMYTYMYNLLISYTLGTSFLFNFMKLSRIKEVTSYKCVLILATYLFPNSKFLRNLHQLLK